MSSSATLSASPVSIQVRKRSGSVTDYRRQKIEQAIRLCLVNSCGWPDNAKTCDTAVKVANRVENSVRRMAGPVDVEVIQDLVEQALYVSGEPDAGRRYVIHREEHRKLREQVLDSAVETAIKQDITTNFRGNNRDLQIFQHFDKYARFNDEAGRRETSDESARRVITYLVRELTERHGLGGVITPAEWSMLERSLISGAATPSMRLLQTAGPAAWRCNMGVFNCAFAGLSDLDYFHEGLYISMQGTGFAFSCESQHIEKLPQIQRQRENVTPDRYVIPDTTEGWGHSTRDLAIRLYNGHDLNLIYDDLRAAGTRLKTKGGTASGPKVLMELHQAMRRIIKARQGRRLRDIDAHDLMCYVGRAGEAGGFRRAAMLSLSDFESAEMRTAKFGAFWNDPTRLQRTMANNSTSYNEKPDAVTFMREWLSLAESKSGERGIFNRGSLYRQMPQRRGEAYGFDKNIAFGCNPCGEIILHPDGGTCNLSIVNCYPGDTEQTLLAKVEIAAIFGTLQALLTNFNYLRPVWKLTSERERLLGVSLDGAVDCPLLREGNPDRPNLLQRLKARAVETNQRWAGRLGIHAANAATCIKPGGNSGARWGVGQAMSGWLAPHMIRNVEVGNTSTMCKFLKDAGVPHEISYRDDNTSVFSFPLKAPAGAQIVADVVTNDAGRVTGIVHRRSAVHQLEDWLVFKKNFTEHNPSVSIYVADDEWLAVGQWVHSHWEDVGGLSFFPLDSGVYQQAPFTPVTEAEFDQFISKFPEIPWEKLPRYDGGSDQTDTHKEKACGAGGCLI